MGNAATHTKLSEVFKTIYPDGPIGRALGGGIYYSRHFGTLEKATKIVGPYNGMHRLDDKTRQILDQYKQIVVRRAEDLTVEQARVANVAAFRNALRIAVERPKPEAYEGEP